MSPRTATLPPVRTDLEILRTAPDQYVLRDPQGDEVFELGFQERFLLEQLDGTATRKDVSQRFQRRFHRRLERGKLDAFLAQLKSRGLLGEEKARAESNAARGIATRRDSKRALNFTFDVLTALLGWLVHPFMIAPVLVLATFAAMGLWQHAGTLVEELAAILDRLSLLQIVLLWVGLVLGLVSLPNAILTGVACRAHGGHIEWFGLGLYRKLVPYFGCDTGDSLVYMSSGGRWAVLSVRLWSRLAIASLAVLGWRLASPDTQLHTALTVLILPAWIGLVLRLIVLNPMEGCALLSYALGVPRMRERALAATNAWLTFRTPPEALARGEQFWFHIYGVLTWLWRIVLHAAVIYIGGKLLVANYGGVGALIGLVLVVWWYHEELGRLIMLSRVLGWLLYGGPWFVRWPVRLALLAGVVACGLIPYNIEVGGDCRLIPQAEYGVRPAIAGQIVQLHVATGDTVQAGDKIVSLSPHEHEAAIAIAEADLAKAQAELALLHAGTRPETIAVAKEQVALADERLEYHTKELERLEGLSQTNTISDATIENARYNRDEARRLLAAATEELAGLTSGARAEELQVAEAQVARVDAEIEHLKEQLELTVVRAPGTGRVVTTNLEEKIGQYVQPGDLVAVLQDAGNLRVEINASEDAVALIEPDQPVKVRLLGLDGAELNATVESIGRSAMDDDELALDPYRTDREHLAATASARSQTHYVPVYAALADQRADEVTLLPKMTGHARVVIREDQLYQAIWRHLYRFWQVEVWSWLP